MVVRKKVPKDQKLESIKRSEAVMIRRRVGKSWETDCAGVVSVLPSSLQFLTFHHSAFFHMLESILPHSSLSFVLRLHSSISLFRFVFEPIDNEAGEAGIQKWSITYSSSSSRIKGHF